MKKEIKSIVSFLCCCFFMALQAKAQPTYWEKAEAKYQSDYRQRIVDNMNTKPGQVGTTPATNGSTPGFMKTKEQKAADAAYVADVRQREYNAAQREQDRIRDHQLYLQRIAFEKAEQKRVFITNGLNQLSGSKMFSRVECEAFAQDEFYRLYSNIKSPNPPDYLTASRYVMKFINADPETPLDTLINYVWRSRFFSDFSTKKFQELQQRFPAAKERLERLELNIVPNYFGASTPYVSSPIGYTYPLCSFELMNDDEQQAVLNRFEELESAYPEIALKAAGYCREGFNPYFKYATSNLALKNKTSAKRLAYLYKTMATIQPDYTLSAGNYSEATWRYTADLLLRPTANEMKLIYPGFVEELTAEQWLDIATASKLNVKYIAWAFRDGNDEKNYLKKLPNLTNALKDEFKKEEDGDGTITFENRDKYVGEIKDGKPNGKGKYTSITGNIYQGIFKDGYLNGSGKAYYKHNVSDKGRIFIWEGDEYEGDFKNGERHGQGKLTNPGRLQQNFVGGWANNEREGYGEQYYNGKLAFKGEYKKGYEVSGTAIKDNGDTYTGNVKGGRYDGKGILKYADGSILEAEWDEDRLAGKAKFTSVKGYVKKSYYETYKIKYDKVTKRTREVDIKYYNPDGKEIAEAEYNANK